MKIIRILNNNVVITLDGSGQETIIMGKGIGYQKSKGEEVDKKQINKIFHLSNPEIAGKLQVLLNRIPMDAIHVSDSIIEYAQEKIGKELNENLYISLSDHIYTAIQRAKDGINIKNGLLWEIKKFYKTEYEIGQEALRIIEQRLGVKFPDDEAGFIAFHIVQAQTEEERPLAYETTRLMQEITNLIRYHFKITFHEESVFYYRFITHLKFFAQRLFSSTEYEDEMDQELLDLMTKKYRKSFECVGKIKDFIEKQYHYKLTEDEQMYLGIHIEKIVQESQKNQK